MGQKQKKWNQKLDYTWFPIYFSILKRFLEKHAWFAMKFPHFFHRRWIAFIAALKMMYYANPDMWFSPKKWTSRKLHLVSWGETKLTEIHEIFHPRTRFPRKLQHTRSTHTPTNPPFRNYEFGILALKSLLVKVFFSSMCWIPFVVLGTLSPWSFSTRTHFFESSDGWF